MNTLRIDHVTIAGRDLARLRDDLARVGFPSQYGGVHSNGVTHMALIGFPDNSYLELISTCTAGQRAPWWQAHIAGDGGLCAWAVQVGDVAGTLAHLATRGVAVRGPFAMHRDRPDGVRLEWILGYLGTGEPGTLLPFLIEDRTPRAWRVPHNAQPVTPLWGVAAVVLGVRDGADARAQFQRAWGWERVITATDEHFGAHLIHFLDTPVVLAIPTATHTWLAERLARFGDTPCALLLGTRDWSAASQTYRLAEHTTWFGRRVTWFDMRALPDARQRGIVLGIIEEIDRPALQ
ncbi:MAG: VOC family protein [Anaerolineae bacterium]|nr:VOC family protein [Anaerolineae bacterium]MDW8072425.1 VOC family protein [Anaerolineae bacterium]